MELAVQVKQCQHAAGAPNGHDLERGLEMTRDLGRLHEDRRPDDGSGHHRDGVQARQWTGQLGQRVRV